MKIKTIWEHLRNWETFDSAVNAAMEEGWNLVKRERQPAVSENAGTILYAELVKLDPVPEPEQPDPLEALRNIRDFCEAMPTEKCLTPGCPLSPWCHNYTEDGISPSDWLVPGEEAAP